MNPCGSPFFYSWIIHLEMSKNKLLKIFQDTKKASMADCILSGQVESLKFENYIKVDSFTDIFMKIYRSLYTE